MTQASNPNPDLCTGYCLHKDGLPCTEVRRQKGGSFDADEVAAVEHLIGALTTAGVLANGGANLCDRCGDGAHTKCVKLNDELPVSERKECQCLCADFDTAEENPITVHAGVLMELLETLVKRLPEGRRAELGID